MSDRLVSAKTIAQIVGILVISTVAGLGYNSARGEGDVELGRQYFGKKLAEENARKNGQAAKKDPVTPPANGVQGVEGPDATKTPVDVAKTPTTEGTPVKPTRPETSDAGTETTEVPPIEVPDAPAIPEVPEVYPDGLQRMSVLDCSDLVGSEIAVFVDARKREDYVEGHIPGAVHLSHYESTSQIEGVRPILEQAFMIIVYCNGGDCEDSINLALDLTTTYGFSNDSVYVFEGGMEEWKQNDLAIVKGENRD